MEGVLALEGFLERLVNGKSKGNREQHTMHITGRNLNRRKIDGCA